MTLKAAALVGGRYQLERRIGRGGMAEVWLATDRRLGRPVALKFLDSSFAGGQRDFERETGILAGLRHPNIVTVYDAGDDDGRRFIVMEWVEGQSLRERLQSGGPLSPGEAAALGSALASALAYAHDKGVVHNDVKPENILLEPDGEPRLTDFGVARVTGKTVAADEAAELVGTIAYVAPEVLQGSPAAPASDVYALGTTLFEVTAGRLPFEAPSNSALSGQKLNAAPRPLNEIVPGISDHLATAIMSCLAFSPADRPDAASLAATFGGLSLAATTRETPLVAPEATRPTTMLSRSPGRRTVGRRRKPGALMLLTVLGGAVLMAAGALALSNSGNGDGDSPVATPTTDAHLAAAGETATSTPSPTEPPQQVAPPVANDDDNDDDKDDKKDREKPGRGRGR